MLFHLEAPVDYYVESNGVRSPIFTMTLVDLPTVKQLDIEYHFPAYTGLAPQKADTAGDVAALRGTEVRLRVTPTMAAGGGRIVLNEDGSSALTRQADGALVEGLGGRPDWDRRGCRAVHRTMARSDRDGL